MSYTQYNTEAIESIRFEIGHFDGAHYQELANIIAQSTDKWFDAPIRGWFLTRPRHARMDTFALRHDNLFVQSLNIDKDTKKLLLNFNSLWRDRKYIAEMFNEPGLNGKDVFWTDQGHLTGIFLDSDEKNFLNKFMRTKPQITPEFVAKFEAAMNQYDFVNEKFGECTL